MADPFRLIVWNCNMAFHQKYEQLLVLNPSVAVIPECAQPSSVEAVQSALNAPLARHSRATIRG